MADSGAEIQPTFKFLKGGEAASATLDWSTGPEQVRKAVSEAMNARNVAVLLGAGCSSLWSDGLERGIPTMAPLAKEFCGYPKRKRSLAPTLRA